MKVVHIQWIDSCTEVGWDQFKETDGFDITHSVGFIVNEGEHYTMIANSYDPASDEWNGRIAIPNCSIIEAREICQIKTTKT